MYTLTLVRVASWMCRGVGKDFWGKGVVGGFTWGKGWWGVEKTKME